MVLLRFSTAIPAIPGISASSCWPLMPLGADRLLWFAWLGYLHISLFTLIAPHVNKMGGNLYATQLDIYRSYTGKNQELK